MASVEEDFGFVEKFPVPFGTQWAETSLPHGMATPLYYYAPKLQYMFKRCVAVLEKYWWENRDFLGFKNKAFSVYIQNFSGNVPPSPQDYDSFANALDQTFRHDTLTYSLVNGPSDNLDRCFHLGSMGALLEAVYLYGQDGIYFKGAPIKYWTVNKESVWIALNRGSLLVSLSNPDTRLWNYGYSENWDKFIKEGTCDKNCGATAMNLAADLYNTHSIDQLRNAAVWCLEFLEKLVEIKKEEADKPAPSWPEFEHNCPEGTVWSKSDNKCIDPYGWIKDICPEGTVWSKDHGKCIDPNIQWIKDAWEAVSADSDAEDVQAEDGTTIHDPHERPRLIGDEAKAAPDPRRRTHAGSYMEEAEKEFEDGTVELEDKDDPPVRPAEKKSYVGYFVAGSLVLVSAALIYSVSKD